MRTLFTKSWSPPSGTIYSPGDRADLPPAEAKAAIAAGAAVELPDEERTALERRTKVVSDQPLVVKTPVRVPRVVSADERGREMLREQAERLTRGRKVR